MADSLEQVELDLLAMISPRLGGVTMESVGPKFPLDSLHNSVLGLFLGGHLQLADDDLDLDLVLERGSGNVWLIWLGTQKTNLGGQR